MILRRKCVCKKLIRSLCSVAKIENKVKYTDTVILPKTKFPHYLNAKQTIDRDSRILKECGFSELYSWQRKHLRGKEFTLLDGPPYANGNVHIGHAINKILKDIIIRSNLLQGRRVHFVPGWDCHGLPIELKSVEQDQIKDPVQVRRRAREFARKTIANQKAAFRSWGVMADWEKEVYQTFDNEYIIRELQLFWQLYDQGFLYRDLKPVYWSPSSRTALAEAELVYKDDHVSEAITVRLKLINPSSALADLNRSVYFLIWTTTPWTVPVNEAVCYASQMEYSAVSIEGFDGVYVIGSPCVEPLKTKFQKEIKVLKTLTGADLNGTLYEHPWGKGTRSLLESSHVTASGTGLVHCAPAHGHDDFLVGLRHNLSMHCLVDGEGRYTTEAGPDLAGLAALNEGNQLAIRKLQGDIIHQESYTHSYPYDWRTDKPVLIRASQQWFIDTQSLKESALECLDKVEGTTDRLRSLLQSRPYWCISRQRSWGVPIPVFYHKTTGRPLVTKSTVDALCRQIHAGHSDAWWTQSVEELFTKKACEQLRVHIEDVEKGNDILDIWMDSGVAWSILEGRVADVIIEGGDQHTGWFQSSLLTSAALREKPPTKKILTHGFAVDESGRKMSKSLGNVVDPQKVVQNLGTDTLRWWVASHSHHPLIPASDRHLQSARESINRIRGIIRFLLGSLRGVTREQVNGAPMTTLDKHLLHTSAQFYKNVLHEYEKHSWNHVCTLILNYMSGPISGLYIHAVKDRLYCDSVTSPRRISSLVTLKGILDTLSHSLAPILPHLAEEINLYHDLKKENFWFKSDWWTPPKTWHNEGASECIGKALQVKAMVDKEAGVAGSMHFDCRLFLDEEYYDYIKTLQLEDISWDSELTECLQVASVQLNKSSVTTLELHEPKRLKCPRCRRFSSETCQTLCERCSKVLNS